DHHTRAQLSLQSDAPSSGKWDDRSGPRALHQEPVDQSKLHRATTTRHRARRSRPSSLHFGARAGEPRRWIDAQTASGPLPQLASLWAAGSRADTAEYSLCQIRWSEVSRYRAY